MTQFRLTDRQETLFSIIKRQHGEQKRKYTKEPYWHHLQNVASIIQKNSPGSALGIEVALCHDVIEDTSTTANELLGFLLVSGYHEFEAIQVVKYVVQLTDKYTKERYPEYNRMQRKEFEAQRLVDADPVAQTVKYADVIDNISSIADHDPEFAKVYLSEKDAYFDKMNRGDQKLYLVAQDAIMKAKRKLGYYGSHI